MTNEYRKDRKDALISELAELRVADVDTSLLMELSTEERCTIEQTIATLERKERKRLRTLSLEKLYELRDRFE